MLSFLEFFEVCIAEEQYEAQKLTIMKDALRAKPAYTSESRRLSADTNGDRELSPTPSDTPISILEDQPMETVVEEQITVDVSIANGTQSADEVPASNGISILNDTPSVEEKKAHADSESTVAAINSNANSIPSETKDSEVGVADTITTNL